MTILDSVPVTYVGQEDPFKDRSYRTGLTFAPGQTRLLPPAVAARFLRHEDVFKQGAPEKPAEKPAAPAQPTEPAQPVDDTAQLLEQTQQKQEDQRKDEDARFALLDQIDAMDRKGVIEWTMDHYKQKIPGNVSVANARDMAKGFVDQYGMP